MIGLLTDGLAARGVEVTLFPSGQGEDSAAQRAAASAPLWGKIHSLESEVSECLKISELFDRVDDFDLIHNHAGFLPLTYSRLINRPILTTIHEFHTRVGLSLYKRYNDRAFYVAVGNAARSPELTYQATIYYGIDVDAFTLRQSPATDLLFCGPIHPESGVTEAIKISRMADKGLLIAGQIQDETCFSVDVAPFLEGNRIRYVGPLRPELRDQLFGSALALLHPVAREEPFDFSILEATACGTPVIAYPGGMLREIISDGINGFVVPDIVAASEAVKKVHTISRANCRKTTRERFSQHRMVDEYLKVYETILDRTRTEDRRPWGYYVVLSDLPDNKVKRIVVWPGKRLSLQRHRLRSEHWTIIAGAPMVTIDGKDIHMKVGQSIDIPVGTEHRIYNPGQDPVVFVEVQMGEYFGEDDIQRFEDDFGRL